MNCPDRFADDNQRAVAATIGQLRLDVHMCCSILSRRFATLDGTASAEPFADVSTNERIRTCLRAFVVLPHNFAG